MTMSALSDELAQVRTKKKEFLAQIERIVPWKEWLTLIQPCYYKGERGNKPYPLETMLRLYLLQNLSINALFKQNYFCGNTAQKSKHDTARHDIIKTWINR